LNATVNPNGSSTVARFEYGESTSYGNQTASTDAGTGSSFVPISLSIEGLQCGTQYHFRVVAQNAGGIAYGSNRMFTTDPCDIPPTAVTEAATDVSRDSATLNAAVNPNESGTEVWFEYGESESFGFQTDFAYIGSGAGTLDIFSTIDSLLCETTYYFRVVAENSAGLSQGSTLSFTTASCSDEVFNDGFETGDTGSWSMTVGK
jgi:hypothetical protein